MTTTIITPENQGPIVNVVQWVFMVTMIMATMTKVYSKWERSKTLTADDYFLTVATLFAIAQTIAVSEQVTYGLGNSAVLNTSDNSDYYQQAAYASQILYVITLCFTKLATAAFVQTLAPLPWLRKLTRVYMMVVAAWTTFAVFALAFQCGIPQPWAVTSDHCFDQLSFWAVYGAVDIVTDLGLVVVPTMLVSGLQADLSHRISVTSSFAARAINTPLIVLRLVYLATAIRHKASPYSAINAALLTAIQMDTGIILACVPFIKVVLDRMQMGLMTSDLVHGHQFQGGSRMKSSFHLSELMKSNARSNAKKSNVQSHVKTESETRLEGDDNIYRDSDESRARTSGTAPDVLSTADLKSNQVLVRTTIATTVEQDESPPNSTSMW